MQQNVWPMRIVAIIETLRSHPHLGRAGAESRLLRKGIRGKGIREMTEARPVSANAIMIAATLRMQIGPAWPVRYTCAARVCIAHANMMQT